MSTFMFKYANEYTPVSNVFIDKFMPQARGEYIKVYLLGLKYCMSGEPGVNSSIIASKLHLLESDIMNAWNYWNDEGVIKLVPVDNMGNFKIEFLTLSDVDNTSNNKLNLLKELSDSSVKDMLEDIEDLVGRPLSSKEMSMYIEWLKDYNFSPEVILLMIQYCISKGKTDYRYIERVAISWHDAKITTVDLAQSFIKKHEDKWVNIRKILDYMGLKDAELMKPQKDLLDKWLNAYGFSIDLIFKACDICSERLNRPDFKYIDGILTSWHKNNIKTLNDVATKDVKKTSPKKSSGAPPKKGNFNNYEQRSYDFDKLEKKLLEWENNYD